MAALATIPTPSVNPGIIVFAANYAAKSSGSTCLVSSPELLGAPQPLEFLSLVRSVARRIHSTLPRHIEMEDLVSAGYLGLLDAVEKFRESHQAQFRTYAELRIRGAILDSLRELDGATRSMRRRSREIERTKEVLTTKLGRVPEEKEIAEELTISLADLRETLAGVKAAEIDSLQAEREDEDGHDLLSTLADTKTKDALSLCLDGEFKQRMVEAIDSLPERERLVITLSFYEELTLKEIGEMLSITESRVSQIRSKAIAGLRTALHSSR